MREVQAIFSIGTALQEHYCVEDVLGKGTSGAVYLVSDRRVQDAHNRLCVLKQVIGLSTQERYRSFFEAVLLGNLHHEALPQVNQVINDVKHGSLYLLMEYIEGQSLDTLMSQQPEQRLTLPDALTIMSPIIEAVSYLHHQQPVLIHGDIKPANIIVSKARTGAMLVDWGIRKEDCTDAALASDRERSSPYQAPKNTDRCSEVFTDIFGLGATLYTLLTGKVPTEFAWRMTQSGNKVTKPLKPENDVTLAIPAPVAQVIHRAMSIRADDQFTSVEQLWESLQSQMRQLALLPATPSVFSFSSLAPKHAATPPTLVHPVMPPLTSRPSNTPSMLSKHATTHLATVSIPKSSHPAQSSKSNPIPPETPRHTGTFPAIVSIPKPSRRAHVSKSTLTPPVTPRHTQTYPATVSIPKPSHPAQSSKSDLVPPETPRHTGTFPAIVSIPKPSRRAHVSKSTLTPPVDFKQVENPPSALVSKQPQELKDRKRKKQIDKPATKPPLTLPTWKLGSLWSNVRKQAAEKPAPVLEKHTTTSITSTPLTTGMVHKVPAVEKPASVRITKPLHTPNTLELEATLPAASKPAVDNLKRKSNQRIKIKRQKARRPYFIICALLILLLGTVGSLFSIVEYQTYSAKYHTDLSLAQAGIQHLQTGVALSEAIQKPPLNASTVQKAQHEFTESLMNFSQLDAELKSLPGIGLSIPTYGARLRAALHLIPIAIEVSQTGVIACNTLDLLISRFDKAGNTRAQGLTVADFSIVNQNFQRITALLNLVISQVNRLQPEDLQLDPRLSKLVTTFHKDVPALQAWFDTAEKILPLVPTVLGIGTPTNYLIEVLDPTQLSPGGGVIDSYGTATFSGGLLTTARITDVDLLDDPFEAAGGQIPFPAAYSWFNQAPTWNLRDSNLDADFPTSARNAEMVYKLEGGRLPLAGVIAVTPALVERALAIIGPIDVPEYHETITAQNLVARLHYYRLGPGTQANESSQPNRFTEVFAAHFLARLHQQSPSALLKFWQEVFSSLHSKDVQIYLNSSAAEHLLQSYHLDAAIQSPGSDSLYVVDANIGASQVNSFITNELNDQVTIDENGNAIHHTTLRYAWVLQGQNYGSSLYQDYLRVYAPPGSVLHAQDGWEPRGTSKAFGREVWAGFFTLSYGQTETITLIWKASGVATKDAKVWHYKYEIQRQAGAQWALHLQVTLPSCAERITTQGGLVSSGPLAMTFAQSLNENMDVGVNYSC